MTWIEKKASGKHLVRWREPDGRAASKTARTNDEARALKANVESELHAGSYIAKVARERPLGKYVLEEHCCVGGSQLVTEPFGRAGVQITRASSANASATREVSGASVPRS